MATANAVESSLEVRDERHGRLRLSFLRTGDRCGHRAEWLRGEHVVAAIESVEAEGDAAWPASPPLQQLNLPPSGDRPPVALLVGMAGRSHWSASVEAVPGRGWRLDVACRCPRTPGWLGSSYRVLHGPIRAEGPRVLLGSGPMLGEIRPEPLPACPDPRLEAGPAGVTLAASVPDGPSPVTVRWRYLLQWAAADQET